ncbi:hypothetical protein CHELA40_10875 [Chelatococcus asaccharovorans]|nr:hypothetical protein CHELA40_10875 [Chelatococcus asaccharovorans]CAH1685875.1 hypothetical protein CHELA17_64725 [Chelatococcus asaccharovorans]
MCSSYNGCRAREPGTTGWTPTPAVIFESQALGGKESALPGSEVTFNQLP